MASAETDQEALETALRKLAGQTGVRIAFICEPSKEAAGRAQLRAILRDGEVVEPFDYDLEGTPCKRVYEHGSLYHSHGVAEIYSEDEDLQKWGVDNYLGVAMSDAEGRMIGHVGVLNDEPLEDPAAVETHVRSTALTVGRLLVGRS